MILSNFQISNLDLRFQINLNEFSRDSLIFSEKCCQYMLSRTTDAQRGNSLHYTAEKFTPTPKFLGMAAAYFVCHIGPFFQISWICAFIGCP